MCEKKKKSLDKMGRGSMLFEQPFL